MRRCIYWKPGQINCELPNIHCRAPQCFDDYVPRTMVPMSKFEQKLYALGKAIFSKTPNEIDLQGYACISFRVNEYQPYLDAVELIPIKEQI